MNALGKSHFALDNVSVTDSTTTTNITNTTTTTSIIFIINMIYNNYKSCEQFKII